MASEEAIHKLEKLSPREWEILKLRCDGLDYKTIGQRLSLSESTVKTHVGHVYVKLDLDQLRPKLRWKAIDMVFCPALKAAHFVPVPQKPEPSELQPVPERVRKMVEDDETAIIPYERPSPPAVIHRAPIIIDPDKIIPARRGRWTMAVIVLSVLAGMLLMAGLFFVFRGFLVGTATPVAQAPIPPTITLVTQPVTVVVTATPLPAVSTATKIPSPSPVPPSVTPVPPSATPVPPSASPAPQSATPPPSPTLISDTPPGSILQVGQSWRQGGSALTLLDFELHPARDDSEGQLYVTWRFTNNLPHEIILSYTYNNFSAKDNLGNRLKTLRFYNESFWTEGASAVVRAGESCDFSTKCDSPGAFGFKLPIVVNLSNKQLSEVIVGASGISSIENAQWRIPIFH